MGVRDTVETLPICCSIALSQQLKDIYLGFLQFYLTGVIVVMSMPIGIPTHLHGFHRCSPEMPDGNHTLTGKQFGV